MQKNADPKGTYLIYPNPSQGNISIVTSEVHANLLLELFTNTGYLVHKQPLGECSASKPALADLSHLSRGVYVLRLSDGKETYETKISLE